jgi:hypothetical protein
MKISRAVATVFLLLGLFLVADLLLAPPNPISSLSLSPTSVLGGGSSTGTVTLNNNAPTGGAVVGLTSSNGSAATVPSNVTVPAGQRTATFPVTTSPVGASTSVTITATYSGGSRTATLTVTPAVLTSASVSPGSVAGGTPSTGTVSLSGPAPASGASITLSSSNPSAASVPGMVTVPSSSSSATFAISTFNVASSTNVTITAVYNGTTKTATLTVTPAPPALSAISVTPTTVVGSSTANGTATLNQPAPTGGAAVALSSSDPTVAAVPSSVTVPSGSTSTGFTISTSSVVSDTTVTISGTFGSTKNAALTVVPTFTVTLDNGTGPIYTNQSSVGIRGHVAPAPVGPSVLVRATLGAQTVTTTPASNGAFTLPNLTLALGANTISVSGTSGSQSAAPIDATYIYDNVAPTASVILTTNVPNPTNIPTWTLAGTINPYQGPAENAFVYLNGGSTRFPIATDGTWGGTYTFVEGRNAIPFVVADLAGNYYNTTTFTFYLDTQGLKPLVWTSGYASADGFTFGWPVMLDESISTYLDFGTDSGASLDGSHLDLYFDEQGSFPGSSPVNCAPDNLGCVAERKAVPDISVDFPTGSQVVTPRLSVGIHTIRMVLRDPFGNVYERGALLPLGWIDQSYRTYIPLANFGVPGIVTTQTPKLVGMMVDGVAPLDCNDNPGNSIPSFFYWNSSHGGAWEALAVESTSVTDGVYEVVPSSRIPITTDASGQKVLRIKLTEGALRTGQYGSYLEGTFGRNICNGQTVISTALKNVMRYWGNNTDPFDPSVSYDLPYRSASQGDNLAPQIDTSGVQDIATDTSGPYTLTSRLRVTDLNADLDYRNVTVATAGCGNASCTYSTRLAGDQLLTSAQPGGYFNVQLPLTVGANNFVATARDDAGHVTAQSFTVNRSLTEVEAKITSPSLTGSYAFCSPKLATFDASQSINRTSPQTALRYQWTASPTNSLMSTQPTYTETLQSSGSRRVIVSSTAITAPPYQASDPCSGNSGKCSVAMVSFQPFTVPTGTLPAQIQTPSNGASVRMDVPVTLDGTVGQNADPSYVYKWRLKRNLTGLFLTIPQSTGTGSDPSYAVGNRTLMLRLDSIPEVVSDDYGYTLYFDAAYQATPGNCIAQETTSSIEITVTAQVYTATGVAPGVTIPGGSATRLYGSGFDSAAHIAISGPVYTLTNPPTQLCTMPACPQVVVAAAANVDGTTLDFATPANLTPGIYLVFASDPATGAASLALWLEVQPPQTSAPPKTQEFTSLASYLVNGQTLDGQFLVGRDPTGQHSDADYYYFFATAGSALNVSLSRSDSSLPWEAPDALDPELRVIDPDGIISQGFESFDIQPGVDLNASLSNLVLPKTGRYFIEAATSKGSGPYGLTFNLAPVAATSNRQVIPAADNDRTVPLTASGLKPTAFVFDRRGYPLAGAVTRFVATPEAGETGQVGFSSPYGTNIPTDTRGFTQVDAALTAAGKISFEARLIETGLIAPQEVFVREGARAVPSYRPIASVTSLQQGFDRRTGDLRMNFGRVERIELAIPEPPVTAFKKGKGAPARQNTARVTDTSRLPGIAAQLAPSSVTGLSLQTITTCSPATFRAAGVDPASEVRGPFTVTLTDLTPKTGQSTGTEEIGVEGINKHRVDKTIRIKIGIKDATGAEPNYPVLVHLAVVGGEPAGRLILDPDGARIECQSASFLWHERDEQGNIIALNEEVEYRLTTRSAFVGVKPDPQTPGAVLPVWGTTEILSVFFGTFDGGNATFTNQFSAYYGVHPEPGTPHHLRFSSDLPPPPHRLEYLTAYDADFRFATYTNNVTHLNLYHLADSFNNDTYGFTATSATNPAGNIQATFAAQIPTAGPLENWNGYKLALEWNNSPQWPDGEYVTTLSVTGTDPETGPFTVSQAYTAVFTQPLFYSLVWCDACDYPHDVQFDFSVEPPVPITFVSPGAPRARLNGELSRNTIFLVTGTRLSWTGVTPIGWIGPPGTDPTLVTDGLDSFDVSLVDDKGNLVTDGEMQVAFCLVWDVEQNGPCPAGNRTSTDGVILGVRPIDRGYMGLMVSKAPTAPGGYFFRIKPVPSNVHQWRVGGSLDPDNNYTYTYAVTVRGGEFINENFGRFPQGVVKVTEPTLVYLRYTNASGAGPGTAELTTLKQDGTELQSGVSLSFSRLASSPVYIGEFTALPEGDTNPPPPGRPSIGIALGGGQIKATQTTAGTLSAQSAGVQPQGAQSSNGSLLAMAPTAFPGELRLKFMTRDGSALAPNPSGDPTKPGTQLTEIGNKSEDYSEKVWVEIQAFNPKRPEQLQDTTAPVGIVEHPNPNYTDSTDRFYDGTNGSTLLDDSGKIGGTSGAFRAMVGGKIQIELTAVADRRLLNVTGNPPDRDLPYYALLQPVPSDPADPRMPRLGVARNVEQWVDERTYERRRTDPGKTWGLQDSQNSVRDWLEKKAWDTYTDTLDQVSGQLDTGCRVLTTMEESRTQTEAALVLSNTPWKVSFNPLEPQARHPAPLPGQWWDKYYYGFYEKDPRDGFPAVALHEARHSWQFTLQSRGGQDVDGDVLFERGTIPPESAELFDAGNRDVIMGGNGDGHFKGDGVGLADTGEAVRTMREHEAMRFLAPGRAGIASEVACALSRFSIDSGGDQAGPPNQALSPLVVRVDALNQIGQVTTSPQSGVTVRFAVLSGGASVEGGSTAYAMTNDAGLASVTLTNGATDSQIRVEVLPPMPPQNTCPLNAWSLTTTARVQ